jgi:glutamine amidotransferase
MNKKIVILDYGLGNLFSIDQAVRFLGYSTIVSSDPKEILIADYLILPGVGSFEIAMKQLYKLNLVEVLKQFVKSQRPVMGICLGMQLLFEESHEFGINKGLGIIEGRVLKFPNDVNGLKMRVPHIGWNRVYQNIVDSKFPHSEIVKNGSLMYFVHSFYAKPLNDKNILTKTNYLGFEFCSAVNKDNVFGFQFHPEKSGEEGLEIYNNFLKI